MELIKLENGKPTVSSTQIAEHFSKQHKDVIRKIENLDCSADFNQRNFTPVEYLDLKGELRPSYQITRDGFTYLAMGFTGKKAAVWKEKYILAFNELEKRLNEPTQLVRTQAPVFLASLQNLQEQNVQMLQGLVQVHHIATVADQKADLALTKIEAIESEREQISLQLTSIEIPTIETPTETTRMRINKIVQDIARLSGRSHQLIWNDIYADCRLRCHIDLPTRAKNSKAKSTLEYAESNGFIEQLYSIAYSYSLKIKMSN